VEGWRKSFGTIYEKLSIKLSAGGKKDATKNKTKED